ncbi:uncharacterized protein LOC135375958 [Ornithodoros turicata]|uniref:uncharacterized protein LOC135375958 n=1 Tax=Ornithodoros turicata TaxID=34597 RepID=UPI00313A26A2
MNDRYTASTSVFTDGSSTRDDSSSESVIPSQLVSCGHHFSHKTSSACAELYAILFGMQKVSVSPAQSWVVFTDSGRALQCMANLGIRGSLSPVVFDILEVYKKAAVAGYTVALQWIPGHVGISGSEEADRAALSAHQHAAFSPIMMPSGDRRYVLSTLASPKMQAQWQHDIAHSLLSDLDPTLSPVLPPQLPRPFTPLFHRMRLTVVFTPVFQHRLGSTSSFLCPTCGVRGDLCHVILACGKYHHERALMEVAMQRTDKRPFNLAKILEPWSNAADQMQGPRLLAEYLCSTGLVMAV